MNLSLISVPSNSHTKPKITEWSKVEGVKDWLCSMQSVGWSAQYRIISFHINLIEHLGYIAHPDDTFLV